MIPIIVNIVSLKDNQDLNQSYQLLISMDKYHFLHEKKFFFFMPVLDNMGNEMPYDAKPFAFARANRLKEKIYKTIGEGCTVDLKDWKYIHTTNINDIFNFGE